MPGPDRGLGDAGRRGAAPARPGREPRRRDGAAFAGPRRRGARGRARRGGRAPVVLEQECGRDAPQPLEKVQGLRAASRGNVRLPGALRRAAFRGRGGIRRREFLRRAGCEPARLGPGVRRNCRLRTKVLPRGTLRAGPRAGLSHALRQRNDLHAADRVRNGSQGLLFANLRDHGLRAGQGASGGVQNIAADIIGRPVLRHHRAGCEAGERQRRKPDRTAWRGSPHVPTSTPAPIPSGQGHASRSMSGGTVKPVPVPNSTFATWSAKATTAPAAATRRKRFE